MSQTRYYLAGPEAVQHVHDYMTRRSAWLTAYQDLAKELGASEVYSNGSFDFPADATIPPGIIAYATKKADRGTHYPDRTPAGKALKARIKAAGSRPTPFELTAKLCGGFSKMRLSQSSFGYHVFDDDTVVIKASPRGTQPQGCELMKASTYWLKIEAEEARKEAP